MIKKLMMDSLSSLGIPVTFQKYSGKSEEYITFHEYLATGDAFEDDKESMTGHYIQVDVWSKTDYSSIVESVKELLILAGFKRLNEIDLYEEDIKIYHKGIKFYYLEEKESE